MREIRDKGSLHTLTISPLFKGCSLQVHCYSSESYLHLLYIHSQSAH